MIREMPGGASDLKAIAARVAKILRDKGRNDEAIGVLAAGAATPPADEAAQGLLADALRIDPNSALARMAFERMEGMEKDHTALDAVIAQYGFDELVKLEKSLRPQSFLKAQVGFNNNIKYKGEQYHVQTEDSGLDKPHIITHLFADGGRIIKSHKRTYAEEVKRPDVAIYVRTLMKGQHMEMVLALREGQFDEIFAGRAPGGKLDVLTEPPKVEIDRVGNREASKPAPQAKEIPAPTASQFSRAVVRARLHVMRSLVGGPEGYDVVGDQAVVGTKGQIQLVGEAFCHPTEAAFLYEDNRLFLQDLEGGNGVFLRIRSRVELHQGDELMVGDQLLRLERNPEVNDGPDPGPTYFRSALKWPSAFRVVHIFEGGAIGAVSMARGTTLQVGSANDYANDLVFGNDPLVSPFHCVIEEQADSFVLSDLGAKSGVFVRITGKQLLGHGSELLVGRTRLLVDLSPSNPKLLALG